MNQDRVTAAFESLLNELSTVVNQTNAQVSQALGDGNHTEATRLVESSQYVDQFKGKIDRLRMKWLTRLATSHLNARLCVKFPNGKVINEPVSADTLTLAIEEIGLDRVRSLNMKVCGTELIANQPHQKYAQRHIGNDYVFIHTDTKTKKQLLETIAKQLSIPVEVSIILLNADQSAQSAQTELEPSTVNHQPEPSPHQEMPAPPKINEDVAGQEEEEEEEEYRWTAKRVSRDTDGSMINPEEEYFSSREDALEWIESDQDFRGTDEMEQLLVSWYEENNTDEEVEWCGEFPVPPEVLDSEAWQEVIGNFEELASSEYYQLFEDDKLVLEIQGTYKLDPENGLSLTWEDSK
jgi:hypothetical protein